MPIKKSSKKQVKVSVLVPIFNVENYLEKCLSSLAAQTLDELEIICINDGSTDSSPKIIQRFLRKDPRFILIDKENSGYGDSMNQGLARARGEYIGIVESDDFIEPNAFAELYALAHKTRADIVRANYFYHSKQGDSIHCAIKTQALETATSLESNFNILYEEPAIWSGLYRREFLEAQKVSFLPTPGASYQDTGFNFKALSSAKTITYTDRAYLHYRTDNSNSSVKSLKKANFVREEFRSIERFLADREAPAWLICVEKAAKFGAYHWNLQRLRSTPALEFLKSIKNEFRADASSGALKASYFPKKYWLALQLILKTPPRLALSTLTFRKKLKRLRKHYNG